MIESDQNRILSTSEILQLIIDITECIEGPEGSIPKVKKINDEIAILTIDGFRFRIQVQDMNQFQ